VYYFLTINIYESQRRNNRNRFPHVGTFRTESNLSPEEQIEELNKTVDRLQQFSRPGTATGSSRPETAASLYTTVPPTVEGERPMTATSDVPLLYNTAGNGKPLASSTEARTLTLRQSLNRHHL
jgi:hypothetical protein